MHHQPQHPAEETSDLHIAHFHHGIKPGNGGHGPLVEVFEGGAFHVGAALGLGSDLFRHIFASLDGHLGYAGKILVIHHVPNDEHVFVTTNA